MKTKVAGSKRNQKAGNKQPMAGNNVPTKTVVFVPSTKGGLLVRKLREKENTLGGMTGFRIKFQEAGGTKLSILFSADLGKGAHCGRSPCPPCDTNEDGKRPNCRSSNLIYESVCTACNPPEAASSQKQHSTGQEKPAATSEKLARKTRAGVYIGETSRSIHERSC